MRLRFGSSSTAEIQTLLTLPIGACSDSWAPLVLANKVVSEPQARRGPQAPPAMYSKYMQKEMKFAHLLHVEPRGSRSRGVVILKDAHLYIMIARSFYSLINTVILCYIEQLLAITRWQPGMECDVVSCGGALQQRGLCLGPRLLEDMTPLLHWLTVALQR